tara:strand:+ start:184 stop:396 length:213 start_codon:yes stop_codon:yes gene_type:complete
MTLQDVINGYKSREKEYKEKYSDRPLRDYIKMKEEQEDNLRTIMKGMKKKKQEERISPTGGVPTFGKKKK